MGKTTKLQVPIQENILKKARKKAEGMGFSSINDVVRFFIYQFVYGNLKIAVKSTPRQASQQLVKSLQEALKHEDKSVSLDSVDDLDKVLDEYEEK